MNYSMHKKDNVLCCAGEGHILNTSVGAWLVKYIAVLKRKDPLYACIVVTSGMY